ncbi:MAG: MATE family efflux transporter [Ruminococcus sp.]|nr:MATE family efflux transporter [Ruminococcus sp.]
MAQTYDLTKGKTTPIILKFFFPMLLTNMLQQIYTIADTMIVGKGLGDDPLAAVGNMSSLTFFIIGFSMGLTNGFSVSIAQAYGAKDTEGLRKSVASSIMLSGVITVLLTAVSMIFLNPVLVLLQTSEVIMADSLLYGYIIFGGLVTTIAYNLCASILRALGDSKTPFIAIVFSTIFNIVFNWVSIFVLHMGVEGPAAVTILSQVISAAICYAKLRKIEAIRLTKAHFRENFRICLELLKNGIPMAIMNSITAVGCMMVQYFVNGMGVAFTSAYSACSKYINLFMQPACTAGITMSSFTSQNFGAKKYGRIAEGFKVCMVIALITYIIFGSVMVFFPRFLASMMLNGEQQIELAMGYLVRSGVMIFAVDFLFVVRSGCQGLGKPLFPMISGIVEMVMRVAVIVMFTQKIGFNTTAYAEMAAWAGALLINATAFGIFLRGYLRSDSKDEKKHNIFFRGRLKNA